MTQQTSFISKALHLPSTSLHFLLRWTFGAHVKYNENNDPIKRSSPKSTERGLMSAILDSVKAVGVWLADIVYKHETAVSTAFWLSAILAGAAALTVYLWPAALVALATASIGGISIAGVFGTSTAALVGGVAAVTAVATSAATYLVASIANFVNWAKGPSATDEDEAEDKAENKAEANTPNTPNTPSSAAALSKLGTPQKTTSNVVPIQPSHHVKESATAREGEPRCSMSALGM